MKLFDELKRATSYLGDFPRQWALCGGVAASIYRSKARFTDDIDFALIDSPDIAAGDLARQVIQKMGYRDYLGFIPDPRDVTKQLQGLICARESADERFVGLDFLLPVQCWVNDAVAIAQSNLIDFGFAKLPTIVPEDLIVAKLIAVTNSPDRFQDLDDIKEIVQSVSVDISRIRQQISKYSIKIEPGLLKLLGPGL